MTDTKVKVEFLNEEREETINKFNENPKTENTLKFTPEFVKNVEDQINRRITDPDWFNPEVPKEQIDWLINDINILINLAYSTGVMRVFNNKED